jgi:hypothetical protein
MEYQLTIVLTNGYQLMRARTHHTTPDHTRTRARTLLLSADGEDVAARIDKLETNDVVRSPSELAS